MEVIGADGKSPVPLIADVLTVEQQEQYLADLRDGIGRHIAADKLGMTGTQMNRFLRREPAWQARVADALEEGRYRYREKVQEALRRRALADDDEFHMRALEIEAATHGGEEYAHLRRNRMQIEGTVEHRLVIPLDPAVLDQLPEEDLAQIEEVLAKLGGEIIDGEAEEIE